MFEEENVHKFYSIKSSSFSDTRYKPWNSVDIFLKKYYNSDKLILDSGCGNGRNILKNEKFFCVDYSKDLLKIAKFKHGNSEFIRADVKNHPYRNNTFDLIISIGVIHHLLDKEKGLKDLYRISKKECKVLIVVWSPEIRNENKFIKMDQKDFGDNDYLVTWQKSTENMRYYHFYEKSNLIKDCKGAGFDVLECEREKESLYIILEKTN